jgi:hypothetical protein
MSFTSTNRISYFPKESSDNLFLYDDFTKKNSILKNDLNGRINILSPQDPDVVFKMQEKIAIKNKATPYGEALAGTWENNLMSKAYFSAENVQILQNGLRAGVYEMSDKEFVIAPQNIDTLKVIMRSIYLQYAQHEPADITGQIKKLNSLVLDYAIPTVYKEVKGYLKYCEDQSTIAMPLAVPKHHDRQYKQLELKPYF